MSLSLQEHSKLDQNIQEPFNIWSSAVAAVVVDPTTAVVVDLVE
tara:strand:- start:1784 stop:1915 length:132 start_codon:yes stop_codon:yes gene_type:complete